MHNRIIKFVTNLLPTTFLMLAFLYTNSQLTSRPREEIRDYLSIYFPVPIQLIQATGDKFLAANINTLRSFTVGVDILPPETVATQASLQQDAAFFNPYNSDNYYLAAATLPWNGHLTEAQYILERAKNELTQDPLPAFFYAFNILHFEQNTQAAAQSLRESAKKIKDENTKIALSTLAAQWIASSKTTRAAQTLRVMAKETKNKAFAQFLEKKALRIDILTSLNKKKSELEKNNNKKINSINEAINSGISLDNIKDPLGGTLIIDNKGEFNFKNK